MANNTKCLRSETTLCAVKPQKTESTIYAAAIADPYGFLELADRISSREWTLERSIMVDGLVWLAEGGAA